MVPVLPLLTFNVADYLKFLSKTKLETKMISIVFVLSAVITIIFIAVPILRYPNFYLINSIKYAILEFLKIRI
jgi:hypothetical protein